MRTKTKSRILEAVHETATDLHQTGLIDQQKMRQYDALCLSNVLKPTSKKIHGNDPLH